MAAKTMKGAVMFSRQAYLPSSLANNCFEECALVTSRLLAFLY
jgi:hypothetical protein